MSTHEEAFTQALMKDRDVTERRSVRNTLKTTRETIHDLEENWAGDINLSLEDIQALGRVRGILSTLIEKLK